MKAADILAIRPRRWAGIKPNHRGLDGETRVVGFDVETVGGRPYMLGLRCRSAELDLVVDCEPGSGQAMRTLLEAVSLLDTRRRARTIAVAHNLRFDLGVMIYDYLASLGKRWRDLPNPEQIGIATKWGAFHLRIGRVCFATLKVGHRVIHFIDTFAYFKCSLDAAAEQLGLTERKLTKPRRLGVHRYSRRFLEPYVRRDTSIVAQLGEQIVRWWGQYRIRPAVSAPQMAGRVFQHVYVKRPWVQLPDAVTTVALNSYHGGKNGFYTAPGPYPDVCSYDVRSAYAWAMTQIPPMTRGEWQWTEGAPEPGSYGFVLCRGTMPATLRYPVFWSHDFQPLHADQSFGPLCVTSMEYEQLARLYPSWTADAAATVTWCPDPGEPRDLRAYAIDMHERRQAAGSVVEQLLYKLLTNSLYGKFIARTPDPDDPKAMLAGQLFYPPVASWITALVRVRITDYEHRYHAVHTSTDGFLTLAPVPADELGSELGSLKLVHRGPAILLRNKLYVHFDARQRVHTAALHGYQGSAAELLTMLTKGRDDYTRHRLLGWREAVRADGLPFSPVTRAMRLHGIDVRHVQARIGALLHARPTPGEDSGHADTAET
jgi:hypothetical protein